jgi:hypothetical protein
MIKPFLVLISVLIGSIIMVFIHYSYYDAQISLSSLQRVTAITHISSPSLSVAYYEPRIMLDKRIENPAYPQMQAINKMDFIYAK